MKYSNFVLQLPSTSTSLPFVLLHLADIECSYKMQTCALNNWSTKFCHFEHLFPLHFCHDLVTKYFLIKINIFLFKILNILQYCNFYKH